MGIVTSENVTSVFALHVYTCNTHVFRLDCVQRCTFLLHSGVENKQTVGSITLENVTSVFALHVDAGNFVLIMCRDTLLVLLGH